jgi:hypothetical protein
MFPFGDDIRIGRILHSSMEITDEFYSNMNYDEVNNRISNLNKQEQSSEDSELEQFREFLDWKKKIGSR